MIAPALSGSEVLSTDQVDGKILRAKRAFARSRHAIAAAHHDLENHQRWLNRHRAAWAASVKSYERQVNSLATRLAAALEPILIVFLSIFVGFILFATILPILEAGNVL